MNALDWAIVVIVGVSLITGIVKGLTRELVSLGALVAGLVAALWWYPEVASLLAPYTSGAGVAGFAAFALILLAFLLLGWAVSRVSSKLIKASGLRWFDRLLGTAFGLARGVLIAAALVLAMLAFAPGKSPIEAVAESRLAPTVLQCARAMVILAPRGLKEGFHDGLNRVHKVWREIPRNSV